MSKRRALPWSARLRAAASVLTTGAVSAGRYGPLVSSEEWPRRLVDEASFVDPQRALSLSSVWACASLLADSVAQLPSGVYQRDGDRRRPLPNHPAARLLNGSVNDAMSRRTLVKTIELSRQLQGNGFAQVERDDGGVPVGVWPLSATPRRDESGRLIYEATAAGHSVKLDPSDVIHIRGVSHDGVNGVSPISAARNALGLSIAAEKFGAKFFANDAKSGGFIVQEARTDAKTKKAQSDAFTADQGGPDNAWKPKILDPGARYVSTTITQADSQFLETREFQIAEVARWYRVPLVLIGAHERNTSWGTGIEALLIAFTQFTITPLAQSWEEELTQKLIPLEDRAKGIYIRLDVRGLMRGDAMSRASFYASGIEHGWLTPNEARAREELDPLPGGDSPRVEQGGSNAL